MDKSFKTKLADFLAAELKDWPDGVVAFGPLTTFNGIAGRPDLEKFTSTPQEWNVAKDSTADSVEWEGEGIPPAGAECEALESSFRLDSGEWRFMQVLFSNSEYVFAVMPSLGNKPKIYNVDNWIFRKYESPEERAARRKAKACDAIATLLMADSAFSDDAARIYDAIAAGEIPGIPPLNDN